MTQSHRNDPLPAIIETWTQQLAASRAQLHSLLVALACIKEELDGTPIYESVHSFDTDFDSRYDKYKFDAQIFFHEETESNLLAMLRASTAMHIDLHVLKHASIETLSGLNGMDMESLHTLIDEMASEAVKQFPVPDYTPHILRSFFLKKSNQSYPYQSSLL